MIRVLLIDHALEDPRGVFKLLSQPETGNCELHCVRSYREILEAFRRNEYDVCVIDSVVDNGLRLFTQARSVGFATPIVLITANDARQVIQAMRNGVADCLIRDELSLVKLENSICQVVEQARTWSLRTQRELRYLSLTDHAREIIYTHDLGGRFTAMNLTGERLLGYSAEEFSRMNITQILAPSFHRAVSKMIEQTLDAHTQTSDVVVLLTKDGRRKTVEITTHPIQHQGKAVEIQGIARSLSLSMPATGGLCIEERNLFGTEANDSYWPEDTTLTSFPIF